MIFKTLFYAIKIERIINSDSFLIILLQLLVEAFPQICPNYGFLSIVYCVFTNFVDVLQIIGKHESTTVVDTQSSIHVIWEPAPFSIFKEERREGVFGTGVDHKEHLSEQVVEEGTVTIEVIVEFILELVKSCLLLISIIFNPFCLSIC